MKKVAIGLLTGLVSVSGWSACTYNFDMTQAQFNQVNANSSIEMFPNSANQKLSFNLIAGTAPSPKTGYGYMGMSSAYANNKIHGITDGDKTVVGSGIVAFEYKMKVPINNLSGNALLGHLPGGAISKLQNGKNLDIAFMYGNNATTNKFVVSLTDGTPLVFDTINTVDGYQRIGVYVNQNTHQVGLITNGTNHGYILNLSDKMKNIAYLLVSTHNNIQPIDANQEVSFEVVTDASKITQSYPTGTTDICGGII